VPLERPRRLRLLFAVLLAVFLVLNLLTRSWVIAVLAGLWLALLGMQEYLHRHPRDPRP
jgi:hypothetical protein